MMRIADTAAARTIAIVDGYPALLRARRRKEKGWDDATRQHYARHRWLVEGVHGRAKTQHGLRRATRRGLANLAIQAYLTAAAMNFKKLAATPGADLPYPSLFRHALRAVRALTDAARIDVASFDPRSKTAIALA